MTHKRSWSCSPYPFASWRWATAMQLPSLPDFLVMFIPKILGERPQARIIMDKLIKAINQSIISLLNSCTQLPPLKAGFQSQLWTWVRVSSCFSLPPLTSVERRDVQLPIGYLFYSKWPLTLLQVTLKMHLPSISQGSFKEQNWQVNI